MRRRGHGRIAVGRRWIVWILTGHGHAEWLSVRAVDGRGWPLLVGIKRPTAAALRDRSRVSQVRIGSVSGHEGGGVRGDGCEDTFLLESLAIGTPPILGCFKARTANLLVISLCSRADKWRQAVSDRPCVFCNSDRQWRCVASVLADVGDTCDEEAEEHVADRADGLGTYHKGDDDNNPEAVDVGEVVG